MQARYDDLPRLHQAIVRGGVQEAYALLKGGLDPNELDLHGHPPITYAVPGHSDAAAAALVQVLLLGGARVDPLPGTIGAPALGLAVHHGFRECVLCLIEGGADPNYTIQGDPAVGGGDRCIHFVDKDTPVEIVRMLLDAKADVHAVNGRGRTALHLASAAGNTAIVRLLLDRGADPAPPCLRDGSTPLHCAAERGHYEIAEMLIRAGAPPGSVKPNGTTPLHMAAQENNVSVLRLLLRQGVPVDPLNQLWCTPLMVAAAHGSASAASVLVSAGASTELRNAVGMAALENVVVGRTRDTPASEAEFQPLLCALFRSPASNARTRSWRWPAKTSGRRATAALAALKRRQEERLRLRQGGGETRAGGRDGVVGGGGVAGAAKAGSGERETSRGGGRGVRQEEEPPGEPVAPADGVFGMVGRWRIDRSRGSDRRRRKVVLASTSRYVTKNLVDVAMIDI